MSALLAACIVLAMHDGDTLTVRCTKRVKPLVVRVLGIDAPEYPAFTWGLQPGAKEALDEAQEVCPVGANVRVRLTVFDKRTSRWVASVECNSVDLGTDLIKRGLAWTYMDPKKSPYPAMMQLAQSQHLGLWVTGSAPIMPSLWRKNGLHQCKDGSAQPKCPS